MQETRVRSLGWEDPLEEEMAIHSGILAWRISWTEEPGRLQSMGLQRAGHDGETRNTCIRLLLYLVILIVCVSECVCVCVCVCVAGEDSERQKQRQRDRGKRDRRMFISPSHSEQ